MVSDRAKSEEVLEATRVAEQWSYDHSNGQPVKNGLKYGFLSYCYNFNNVL